MKKSVHIVLILLFVLILASFIFSSCVKPEEDTVIYDVTQEKISAQISATEDKIKINLNSIESEVGNATVNVVAVKAYEYVEGEQEIYGLSSDKFSSDDETIVVGDYKLGTQKNVEINRYADGFDRLYCKYYVVYDGKILRGPLYTTDIQPASDAVPQFDIKSKKGILGEKLDYYNDLNCSYATINLEINDLIYPNELLDENGEEIPLAHPDDAIEFVSNGKTYYFRKSKVESFDSMIRDFYNAGANITGIIYAPSTGVSEQSETFPAKMTYLPWATMAVGRNPTPGIVGLNTSNKYGFGYVVAVMEFLANRYTQSGLPHGYVANFVIGNEVDYARDYNRISDKHASLDVYMEEYSRLLRLSNLAFKKYHEDITVTMPLTQSWANRGYSEVDNSVSSYAPKAMVEWLNVKTKMEGDYDWGIAPHCYTYGLALSEVFYNDTLNGRKPISSITGLGGGMTNDYETSAKITFSNIELIDLFLNQDTMKYNGTVRSVFLTEQGVSSYKDDTAGRNNQAACIAAVWYKLSQLDSIKSFCYYRLSDYINEFAGDARFGLLDANREPKPAYEVYKYIDTQYSEIAAKDYLRYLRYVDVNGKLQSYENGGVKSYMDLLDVFETNWLKGDYDWNKAKPVTADVVYKWEDKVDLSDVVFESANYLYDGTEKSIAALNVPERIQVIYSEQPTLTEVGSKTITASFTLDGEVVGRRTATISVSKLATNKTVYDFREKVFVTVDIEDEHLTTGAWIGIFRKSAVPGNTDEGDMSQMYCYINQYGDTFKRTYCIQDTISNKLYSICNDCGNFNTRVKNACAVCGGESFEEYLPSGDYVIYYFNSDQYEYIFSVEITVLPSITPSGAISLDGAVFESAQIPYDGEEHELTVAGSLPDGITVEYLNNKLTNVGQVQAVAIFLDSKGVELERRYAVFSVSESEFKFLSSDKSVYVEGETVLVKAYAPANSEPNTWWVGLYLAHEDNYQSVGSIYYYYVKDISHVAGLPYDIRKQIANSSRSEYLNLPAGEYKLTLFNTSGYTEEESVYFTVKELDIGTDGATLAVDGTQFDMGNPVIVTATQPEQAVAPYYVGLFRLRDDVSIDKAIYWYCVADENHVSGEGYDLLAQTVGSNAPTLRAGQYKVALFAGYGHAVKTVQVIEIQLGTDEEQPAAGTIFTDKDVYKVGETVYVTAYAPDGVDTWWVGLYPASQDDYSNPASIRWYYVVDASHQSGCEYDIMAEARTIGGPNDLLILTEGTYKLVLFNTGGYTVQTVVEFTVVNDVED